MDWWNDIWLNEGFASFMEFYVMDKHFPEWKIMEQFKYMVMLSAMSYDELPMTHPLSEDSEFQENIHLMFDRISYDKVKSFLKGCFDPLNAHELPRRREFHEMHQSKPPDKQVYLKKFSYSNSDSQSLWAVIKQETQQSFYEDMMNGWVKNIGYPLITLQTTNETGIFNISQSRMLLTADSSKIQKNQNE